VNFPPHRASLHFGCFHNMVLGNARTIFYFFFYLLPSRILDPLRFQAGGRRRRPNLGFVCFVLMFAVFLVKDASVCYVVVDLVLVL